MNAGRVIQGRVYQPLERVLAFFHILLSGTRDKRARACLRNTRPLPLPAPTDRSIAFRKIFSTENALPGFGCHLVATRSPSNTWRRNCITENCVLIVSDL